MNDDRTNVGDDAALDPSTETNNPQTIDEGVSGDEGSVESLDTSTSTRTKSGVIPSSYGAGGGTTSPGA
jgi:hypothetical protein